MLQGGCLFYCQSYLCDNWLTFRVDSLLFEFLDQKKQNLIKDENKTFEMPYGTKLAEIIFRVYFYPQNR